MVSHILSNAPTVAKPHPVIPIVEEHGRHVLQVAIIVMGCMVGVLMFLCTLSLLIRFFYAKRYHIHNAPILFDLNGNPSEAEDVDVDVDVVHPIWYIRTVGLEQSLIDSIAVFKFKKGEGIIDSSECSVCLGEFEEEESLRLLPKCTHAFHIPCIDTWLLSHQNCPLCRAPIALTLPHHHDDNNASATSSSSFRVEEETYPLRTSLSMDSNSIVLDLDTHYCGHQPSVIDKHAHTGTSTSPTINNNLPSIGPHTLQNTPLSLSMRTSFSHNPKFLFPRHSRSQSSTLPL